MGGGVGGDSLQLHEADLYNFYKLVIGFTKRHFCVTEKHDHSVSAGFGYCRFDDHYRQQRFPDFPEIAALSLHNFAW